MNFTQLADRVRDAALILDVVQQFSPNGIKKEGVNYLGLCPVHSEKTPSFVVSPTRNKCKCFGCGVAFDPIGFVMEIEGKQFKEAIYALADYYHIPYEAEDLSKHRLKVINEKIYHEKPLTNEEKQAYEEKQKEKLKRELYYLQNEAQNGLSVEILEYLKSRNIPHSEKLPQNAYFSKSAYTYKDTQYNSKLCFVDSTETFVNGRYVKPITKGGRKIKMHNVGELNNKVYSAYFDSSKKAVTISEGAINCISICQNSNSMTGIATFATSNKFESADYLKPYIEGKRIVITTDNDIAGCRYAIFLCDLIQNSGINYIDIHILIFPVRVDEKGKEHCVDSNDMLSEKYTENYGHLKDYLKDKNNYVEVTPEFVSHHKQLYTENAKNKEYKPDFQHKELTEEEKAEIELLKEIDEAEILSTKDEIPPEFVLYYVNDDGKKLPICSLDNVSIISGVEGSGKTFLTSMELTALLCSNYQNKIIGNLPHNRRKVVWFDTEQSRYRTKKVRQRVEILAGYEYADNLLIYNLRKNNTERRLQIIEKIIELNYKHCCYYVLDGILDIVHEMNSEKEVAMIKDWLLWVTDFYNIHICCVTHLNPNGEKKAGHIGSYLGRKNETERKVSHDRENKNKKISCEKSRNSEPFNDFSFDINYDNELHIPVAHIVGEDGFLPEAPDNSRKLEINGVDMGGYEERDEEVAPF